MNNSQKTIYGILAFLPVVIGILIAIQVLSTLSEIIPSSFHDEPNPKEVFETVLPLITLGIFAGLLSLSSLIVYIVHAVNNKGIESGERIMWILFFIFIHGISEPIYFLLKIVNQKPKTDEIT